MAKVLPGDCYGQYDGADARCDVCWLAGFCEYAVPKLEVEDVLQTVETDRTAEPVAKAHVEEAAIYYFGP